MKKIYQISPYRVTLNSNFSENSSLVNSILELRAGDLGKSGPGARAKADAKANASKTGRSILSGAHGFVPQNSYHLYHKPIKTSDNLRLKGNQQSGDPSPSTSLNLERPSAVPNSEYLKMTKEQRRNLPDKRDGFISVKGHPLLIARYGQVEFKTPDHGKIHGLPANQKGKTLKTNENVLALRDSLIDMPNRKNIQWFNNGGYQKGTERGYDSVNLYDPDTGVIAVYRKKEDKEYCLFTTTCKLTPVEETHLFESDGNFMTEAAMKNQKGLTIINPITNKNNDDL